MSSTGWTFPVFRQVTPLRSEPNKLFSIKNILDLSEEGQEGCVPSSSKISQGCNCCFLQSGFSIQVPDVPPAPPLHPDHLNNMPFSGFMNWQYFGFTPSVYKWGYGTPLVKEKAFLHGASRKKYKRSLRKKKQRPLFSPYQIQIMETEFSKQRYITEEKRAHLALKVNLTETQVTTWFQNRRTKWKKDKRNEGKSSPDGKFTAYLGTKLDKFLLPQNLPRFSR